MILLRSRASDIRSLLILNQGSDLPGTFLVKARLFSPPWEVFTMPHVLVVGQAGPAPVLWALTHRNSGSLQSTKATSKPFRRYSKKARPYFYPLHFEASKLTPRQQRS